MRRRDNTASQLIKYIFCGGAAVAVDMSIFYLVGWLVFPCFRETDPAAGIIQFFGGSVHEVSEADLIKNYWIIKGISYIVSNAVVYILNVLYVFEAGRHRKPVEIFLFYFFSLFQFLFIWLGANLVGRWGWEATYAQFSMLLLGLITNYIFKKKIVFKG